MACVETFNKIYVALSTRNSVIVHRSRRYIVPVTIYHLQYFRTTLDERMTFFKHGMPKNV